MQNTILDAFKKIAKLQNYILQKHAQNTAPYHLTQVENALIAHQYADRYEFHGVISEERILSGMYTRFHQPSAPYAEPQTIISIKYDAKENECWKRFIICKEMCQSTMVNGNQNVNNPTSLIDLIDALRLPNTLMTSATLTSENIAVLMASEILCPVQDRIRILNNPKKKYSHTQLAQSFRIPKEVITSLFQPDMIDYALAMHERVKS